MVYPVFLWAVALSTSLAANAVAQTGKPQEPSASYHIKLEDAVTLPIGSANSPVSALFGCGSDGSIFVQIATMPGDGSASGDVTLYQVRGPMDVIHFDPRQARYSPISPIMRYFANDSEVIGLVYAKPMEHGLGDDASKAQQAVYVLLTFDQKGVLTSSVPVDSDMRPEQIAVFQSGDLLLIGWDDRRKSTALKIYDSKGAAVREIHLAENDPADKTNVTESLTTLSIYPYGKNLLIMPQDTRRPILEMNEVGVVGTYQLQIPKGYERGLPVSLDRRGWTFRMIAAEERTFPVENLSSAAETQTSSIGLGALQSRRGTLLSFNPDDGSVLRQVTLPRGGFEPACGSNDKFTFITARAGDGRLQLAKGTIVP